MNWNTWWLFVITGLVLDLTPGPAVLYVLSSGLREGGLRSVAASLGILSANAFYFALSAVGLGALVVAHYQAFFWVKWLGAAYLFYLGFRSFIGKRDVLAIRGDGTKVALKTLWWGGLFLQLSNPKAIVFFAAIVPQFIDPARPIALQMGILGVTSTLCEFVVLFTYGLLAGTAARWARQPRYVVWTNRVAGVLLMLAGVGMAALRQN